MWKAKFRSVPTHAVFSCSKSPNLLLLRRLEMLGYTYKEAANLQYSLSKVAINSLSS